MKNLRCLTKIGSVSRRFTIALLTLLAIPNVHAHSQQSIQLASIAPKNIPAKQLIEPESLAQILRSADGEKPLILQVGSHILFTQAHIPESQYIGAAGKESGLQTLHQRVKKLPRNKFLVIYCGCCPWEKCPNIEPAYSELISMGFTHVKALYLKDNFGANWVAQGYPTAKGE